MLLTGVLYTKTLKVYIEDSHQGSFFYLASHLNFHQKYLLLLFDAHSDASDILNSDTLRDGLSTYRNPSEENKLLARLRTNGVIQSYNWIEPLMPSPVEKVIWVTGERLTLPEWIGKSLDVKREINTFTGIFSRKTGDLSGCFEITGYSSVKNRKDYPQPVIASLDLDYFAELQPEEAAASITKVLDTILGIRQIETVTVAISRTFLHSDRQADALLLPVLKYFSGVVNAEIVFEPFAPVCPDQSERAREFYRNRQVPPVYFIERSGTAMRSFLLQRADRFSVNYHKEKWDRVIGQWKEQRLYQPALEVIKYGRSSGGANRVSITAKERLKIKVAGIPEKQPVRWFALLPVADSFNITGGIYEFAAGAAQWVRYSETAIGVTSNGNFLTANDIMIQMDKKWSFGTIRVFAETGTNDTVVRSRILTVSRRLDDSFPGFLTEEFALPYVLGSYLLRDGNLLGSDTLYGSDCANFIIYSARKMGKHIPYLNPFQFRSYLKKIATEVRITNGLAVSMNKICRLNNDDIKKGFLIHFGGHVAAVFHDNYPYGILDENDLLIHQLEGYPEILPLRDFKQAKSPFDIMIFK